MSDAYSMLVGGDRVAGDRGTYEIVNPATEEVVGQAPEASVDQVTAATRAAAEAFGPWCRTAPGERAALLDRLADILDTQVDELVPLVQAETGATLRVATTMQVPQTIDRFRRYAQGAAEPTAQPLPPTEMPTTALAPGGIIGAVVERRPVGVVACITSYNFPLANMAGKLGPALAMGNTVVVKPAPQDPLAVLRMCRAVVEAGFPPGVVNVVTGAGADAGEALVASPHVDMVSFTGSTAVGRRIAEVAGRDMKRLLLELGGKGAAVVFDDADLATAVGAIASVWAFHSGQICTAPTRVIAQRGIYDQLVGGPDRRRRPPEGRRPAGPATPSSARSSPPPTATASRATSGRRPTRAPRGRRRRAPDVDPGFYVAPTLLADAKPDMTLVQEEIFGPVVVVLPFDDEDEARRPRQRHRLRPLRLRVLGRHRPGPWPWPSAAVGQRRHQHRPAQPRGRLRRVQVQRASGATGAFGLHAYSEMQSIVWPG